MTKTRHFDRPILRHVVAGTREAQEPERGTANQAGNGGKGRHRRFEFATRYHLVRLEDDMTNYYHAWLCIVCQRRDPHGLVCRRCERDGK